MPKVEVKVLVPAHAWDRLAHEAGLEKPDRVGEVWFYDTPTLAAYHQGVILRARASEEDGETTVKLRGPDVDGYDLDAYENLDGYKLEEDCTVLGCTPAASLRAEGQRQRPPDRFTTSQLALAAVGGAQIPWSQLVRYGPVATERWKVDTHKVVVERWTLGDAALVEVSRRSGKRPWIALQQLQDLLQGWGVEASGLPGGKTAWALSLLTSQTP